MRNNKLFLFLFISISPAGCMGVLQKNVQYESDYELCDRIATVPSFNVNYENTRKEIISRSISCGEFASEIRMERKLERMEAKIDEANRRASRAESRASEVETQRRFCSIQSNTAFYKRTGYTPPGC
jgi:hypothetical protein